MKYLGGISDPKDLANKEYVDTALAGVVHSEADPIFSASAASGISSTDITNWNGKQAALVSGTNIKTINNESLLGSGNITIQGGGGGAVSGVKGNAESTYRTGDVNLTAANVGAVPTSRTVNNKALSSNISLTASDVSALPLSGGTMTGTLGFAENSVEANFRPVNASYYSTISHQTAGNEATVFATKNEVTSFIFVNGEDSVTNHASNRWQALTPALQIKNNKVAIGKLIANSVTPTYALDVNGTVNATSFEGSGSNLTGVVHAETDPTVPSWAKESSKPSYTASEVGAVPTSRTVNSKALSSDISLTASDVGAVPTSRTVNGKALSSNITLKTSDLTNDSGYITGYTETDPTVPSWAKASSKPTYTASEVGAQPTLTSSTNITVNNVTANGKVTAGAINAGDLTTVESYDINVGSSGATGAQANSANKTKSGYYPMCVAGFSIATAGAYSRGAYLTNRSSGSCTINARVYANTAGVKACTVYVLWMKNTA